MKKSFRFSSDQPRDPNGQFAGGAETDPHKDEATNIAAGLKSQSDAESGHGIKIGDSVKNLFGDKGKVISVSGHVLKVLPEGKNNTQYWHASHTSVSREIPMTVEIRTTPELRAAEGEDMVLAGYAATFNSPSKDLGGFVETIAPGAFKRSLDAKQDVKCLFNHDANIILGRSTSGTLVLEEDGKGLKFRCVLDPNQQAHRDIYASVKRGDISECSFAFQVDEAGQVWDYKAKAGERAMASRLLRDVTLFDVSAVVYPAYNATSVSARSAVTPEIRSAIVAAAKKAAGEGTIPEVVIPTLDMSNRSDEESFEDITREIASALSEEYPADGDETGVCGPWSGKYWICETYSDYVIVCENVSGEYFRIPYVENGEDDYVFGDPQPVEKEWVPSDRSKKLVEETRAAKAEHLEQLAAMHSDTAAAHNAVAAEHTAAADAHDEAAAAIQAKADAKKRCMDSMGDCSESRCECQNRDVDGSDVYDDEDFDDEERSAREKRSGKVRTKTVDGKNLPKSKFAYVGDAEKTETWKLPIHDADHARNALARFSQTEGIPEEKKAGVLRKIKNAAKKFGIDVSDDARALFNTVPMDADEVQDALLRLRAMCTDLT